MSLGSRNMSEFILILFLLCAPLLSKPVLSQTTIDVNQHPQQPFPYREEAVTFVNPKAAVTLVGALTLPQRKGPFPAVLIVVGADRNDRDESFAPNHHPFLVVADALTRRGIAVLRYDKRGVGESGGNFDSATTKDFEEDALNAIEYLKKRVEIDPRKIGIVGHSEGGTIACLAAVDSKDVSFIVLMAAIGVPWDEAVLHANTEVLLKEGVHKEVVSVLTRVGHEVIEEIRNEKNNAKALDKANEIIKSGKENLKEEDWEKYEEMSKLIDLSKMVSPWWRFRLTNNIQRTLEKVKCPVLAMHGQKDLQILPDENLKGIETSLRKGGNADYIIKKFPGLNHRFQTCNTGFPSECYQISQTISPEVLQYLGNWIEKHVK